MRPRARVASVLFLATMALVASEAGCDWPYSRPREEPGGAGSQGGDGGAGSQGGDDTGCKEILGCQGDGGAGGQPPPPPGCEPGKEDWEASDACGVFVSLGGNDENAGTPDAPVRTLKRALEKIAEPEAKTKNVYACAETFDGKVEIQADVTLFGGLDCTEKGWPWIGVQKQTTLTAEAGTIPLTMHGGGSVSVRMADVHVLAEPVLASGASSIAAVADGVTVSLARCTIEAGDAAPGADQSQDSNSATRGDDGNPGEGGCMASVTAGGAEPVNNCEDGGEVSVGGAGGVGQPNSGGSGGDGTPGGSANGGAGQTAGGTLCAPGKAGADGMPGGPGAGATALGTLSQGGYTGVSGVSGMPGTTAQGGGGGGGARGVLSSGSPGRSCPGGAKGVGGASGGSGGAGGCGGKGGLGGSAGGASIALISLDSILQFHDVTLKTGSGGKGGNGAPGQPGGGGGDGGVGGVAPPPPDSSGLDNACNGGRGGQGGQGGRGGGGRGGHSIGIAFRGTPPPMDANGLHFELGEPGLGGEGDGSNGDGASGAKEPTLDFASP
ncbi:PE_PGRS family protein [Sorangium cellulosum So ce56]|uniref:PE_PGRS family protein n=1 Tax=Sorangium cellulosum (strain So ce56) TaxID=448385 RepID=A9FDJ7_SORC5|nr:PE_PGRS family protein [Sorangium cellulosum So ce56]